MKKMFLATVFFGVAIISVQGQKISFDKKFIDAKTNATVIDYGTIDKNSNGMRTIEFTNAGNVPLIISQVQASCGCTTPEYSKEPIMPGKKGKIVVKYNTANVGAFTKTVTVISNDIEQERQVFSIKGVVK